MIQLYETMMTRHTTMVVGPTGGGKSVVIRTLAEAQTKYVYFLFSLYNYLINLMSVPGEGFAP